MTLTPAYAPWDRVALIQWVRSMELCLPDLMAPPLSGGINLDDHGLKPSPNKTGVTRTRCRRAGLANAVRHTGAGGARAVPPNKARMLAQARSWGFANALLADAIRNAAEIADINIFLSRQAPFPPHFKRQLFGGYHACAPSRRPAGKMNIGY
jgi:hypothetical protein